MIAFLRGRPVRSGADHLIIEVAGIGYKVFVPGSVTARLSDPAKEITVHTYLHVREDVMQLFGFLEESDRGIFELLIQVSGIGPRVALAFLSSMNAASLVQAVINEQISVLTAIPGIGKKMAQRVIVELKDKFSRMDIGPGARPPGIPEDLRDASDEALQALVALGYNPLEAKRALDRVKSDGTGSQEPEGLIKLALKELGR